MMLHAVPLMLLFASCAVAENAIPLLGNLSGEWQPFIDGDGAPRHGLGLPTANSLLGSGIADVNVFAVRSLTLPPYTQGPYSTVARNQSHLARLLLNNESCVTTAYQWTPYGFLRKCGEQVTTEVRMAFDDRVVLGRAEVSVRASVSLEIFPQIRKYLNPNCTQTQWQFPYDMQSDPACWNWYAPRPRTTDSDNFVVLRHDAASFFVVVGDTKSSAISVIALSSTSSRPAAMNTSAGGATLAWEAQSSPVLIEFVLVIGDRADESLLISKALGITKDFSGNFGEALNSRQQQFADALTPHNKRYSGHLPVLDTTDADVARVYYVSVLSLLATERVGLPFSVCSAGPGRVWITGGGENASTNTFFWDIAFTNTAVAMLDPVTLKCMLQRFYQQAVGGYDPVAGWGIDWETNHAVGAWYAANDMALFKATVYYVAVSGDFAFLGQVIDGVAVQDQLEYFATYWTHLRAADQTLADYGLAHNLLECVPSYIHMVAAFNAANVWMMRTLASVYAAQGNATHAQQLVTAAHDLAAAVLTLYVPGQGYWNALYPNGTIVPVRHVIDLVYVTEFMASDLPPAMAREMGAFAQRELVTPHWMRAQSLQDLYANFSDRTDHGPYGAYDGWPATLVSAFALQGDVAAAETFLQHTSPVALLGPYGQAHGVRPPMMPYKPFEFTLFNELAGGCFADVIITAVFGLRPDRASLTAATAPSILLPSAPRTINATLHNVLWQGGLYTAQSGAAGVVWTRNSGPGAL